MSDSKEEDNEAEEDDEEEEEEEDDDEDEDDKKKSKEMSTVKEANEEDEQSSRKNKKNANNKIYFAGIQFFQSILDNCNIETFTTISELHPFKLYAKGLEKTGIYENIILCLKCLENLTIKNQQVYNTIENLKNEFYIYGIKRKMDELTFHKVEEISTLAIRVLNYFDDKMKTD